MRDGEVVRVVLVDDHLMLAESLVRLLADEPDIDVLRIAPTAEEGIAATDALRPDVVIMDYWLPDMTGAQATQVLLARHPGIRVIALTGSDRPGAHRAMQQAGTAAWVRKTRAAEDLAAVIRSVHRGQAVDDPDAAAVPDIADVVVHYQPVVDLTSLRIVGFEALARWAHPDGTLRLPDAFIPTAETSGHVVDIDHAVAAAASGQVARWQAAQVDGDPPLWVSTNLSAAGLNGDGSPEAIERILRTAGIAPSSLVVEITETVLLDDEDAAATRLAALHELGVGLALDDFGTAYSSLSYLRRFPFDALKLDLSFVADLPGAPRSALLVESIVLLAANLGLRVVAEGIEQTAQAALLRDLGCGYGQGWLWAPALDAEAATALLEAQRDGQLGW